MTAERACALLEAFGRVEACRRERCPFWEEGGAVLEAGCLLERMLPFGEWTPELAARWLSLRRSIERARRRDSEHAARSLFALLGSR